jgi:hypothetical protein
MVRQSGVFEELNRRKAMVFGSDRCELSKLLPDFSPLVSEIPQDTTRAVTNLLFTLEGWLAGGFDLLALRFAELDDSLILDRITDAKLIGEIDAPI